MKANHRLPFGNHQPPLTNHQPLTPNPILISLALAVLLIGLYAEFFAWLGERWREDDYYAHGPLVPLIAGYLLWQKRETLRHLPREPSRWGLALLSGGLFLQLMALGVDVHFLSGWALLITLAGLILTFGGKRWLQVTAFPLVFLFFAIPLTRPLLEYVSLPLQILSAKLATGFTNLITGLGVTCQGTIMRVEDFEFTVDVPCSGLKSIISLTALAALVTYFTPTANWKKVLLFAASVPVAVAANVGRIFVILCLGKAFGQKVAMGFFHEFSGLLVFFLAVLMIVGLVNLTTLGEKPASPSKPPSENATPCLAASFRRLVGMAAGLLLAANGLAYGLVFPLRRPPPTAANISVFPLCLGEWIGEEEEVPQLYYQMLEADQIIQRTYRRENSPSKVLSKVGLLAVVGRGRRTIHSPVGCYRAAGQQIVHLEERTFALPGRNPTRWCKLLVRTREGERLLALFTYTDGRVTTPSWSRQQFLAALQSLRRDPRPWFQIHLTAPILQDEESAFATLREFLTLLWPFVETATGAN